MTLVDFLGPESHSECVTNAYGGKPLAQTVHRMAKCISELLSVVKNERNTGVSTAICPSPLKEKQRVVSLYKVKDGFFFVFCETLIS